MEDIEIIFAFEYGFNSFCYPYVDDGICDYTCIAAGTGSTKRVIMINVKLINVLVGPAMACGLEEWDKYDGTLQC